VRVKTLQVNRELVDVTDDNSLGLMERLAEPGVIDVQISVEGILADNVIVDDAFDTSSAPVAVTLTGPLFAITGTFAIGSTEIGMNTAEATTFSTTLMIADASTFAYTPVS
jgi:predicted secreted protein